jgi:hypothetical protein
VESRFPHIFNDRPGSGRLLCGADSGAASRDNGSNAHSTYGRVSIDTGIFGASQSLYTDLSHHTSPFRKV